MSNKRNLERPRLARSAASGCLLVLMCGLMLLGFTTGFQVNNLSAWWSTMWAISGDLNYTTSLTDADEVLEYLTQNQADVALVSFSVGANGEPLTSAPVIEHNAAQPMPAPGLEQWIALASYANQVAHHQLAPDTPVTLGEWQRYYLPNTDNGAYLVALQELGLVYNETGVLTPSLTVPLTAVVRSMVRYNDNAAAAYLLDFFGPETVSDTLAAAGLAEFWAMDTPPLIGQFLLWRNHEAPRQNDEQLDTVLALNPADRLSQETSLLNRYLQDEAWREQEWIWRHGAGRVNSIPFESVLSNATLPQATAESYARLIAGVASQSFISPEVSAIMAEYLSWPMEAASLQAEFVSVGTQGVGYPGIINEATYFEPRSGEFAGQTRITVLLLRDMSPAAFLQLRRTVGHQRFSTELASSPEFAEAVAAALGE